MNTNGQIDFQHQLQPESSTLFVVNKGYINLGEWMENSKADVHN